MHVHGGGDSICREDLDIYSTDCSPETDLCLPELQGTGASEYSRRISREFVDDCRGDLEAYKRKYGLTDENAMQVDKDGNSDAEDRVRKLTTEVSDLRQKKDAQFQQYEKQVIALREDLQRSQSRQKSLREAGVTGNTWKVPKETNSWQEQPSGNDPEEQMAFEVHKAKMLQHKLEELERELLAEQQKADEHIAAKDDELRRSRLELQKSLD